jgi:transcriptional regulator with XRE-family HTH domain
MAKLIDDSLYHKMLNGMELLRQREKTGLSQEHFAEECGWTQPRQAELEQIGQHEISVEAAEKIVRVLQFYT